MAVVGNCRRLTVLVLLAFCLCVEARRKRRWRQPHCEKLNISLCQAIGYQSTVFPNPLTNITTQKKTGRLSMLYKYIPRFNCTMTDPLAFVCSVYAPKCFRRVTNHIVPPCREFCEQAAGNCPQIFGSSWPETLNCSRYPAAGGTKLCIKDANYNIAKPRKGKNKKSRGKKRNKQCCRLGRKIAERNFQCDLDDRSTRKTEQEIEFLKDVLEKCPGKESIVRGCCVNAGEIKGNSGQKGAGLKKKGSKRKNKQKNRKRRKMNRKHKKGRKTPKKPKKTND